MNIYKVLKAIVLTFLTAIVLFSTNTLWLKRLPIDINFDIHGNGFVYSSVVFGSKLISKRVNLNESNHIYLRLSKKNNFKKVNFVFWVSPDKTSQLKISNVNLRNGKIKLDDLDKFEVSGAQKEIQDNVLVLTPTARKIVLTYDVKGRPAYVFQIGWFALLVVLCLSFGFLLFRINYSELKKKFDNFNNNFKFMDIVPALIAICFFIVTNILGLEKLFFSAKINTDHRIFIKFLFLVFFIIAWYFIFYVIRKYKQGNPLFKRGVHLFGIYFTLMMLVMLVVWPGTWFGDDTWILSVDYHYGYHSWHHVLTSIEHLLFLQIIPFPAGIIIIQQICISAIVAFVIVKLETTYSLYLKNRFFDLFLKFAPFLSLPMLRYTFGGYRIGMNTYLETAVLVMMLCAIKNKEQWSWRYFTLFTFFSAIIINWRSESIFYLPILLILFYILKSLGTKKIRLTFGILLVLLTACIGKFESIQLRNNNYKIMAVIRPLVYLMRNIDQEQYKPQFEVFNKVIHTNVVYENPKVSGPSLYWYHGLMRKYTNKEFKDFLSSYAYLIVKNPKMFMNERIEIFLSGLDNRSLYGSPKYSLKNFYTHPPDKSYRELFLSPVWICNKPIFPTLRYRALKLIEVPYLYNNYITMLIVLIFGVFLLCKKQYKELLLASGLIIKLPVIILTEPGYLYMYYLIYYIIGLLILYYSLLYFLSHRTEVKNA